MLNAMIWRVNSIFEHKGNNMCKSYFVFYNVVYEILMDKSSTWTTPLYYLAHSFNREHYIVTWPRDGGVVNRIASHLDPLVSHNNS